jgi:hypothetical protein
MTSASDVIPKPVEAKMPRKNKGGRPPGRGKPKLLSVRVTKEMWHLLNQKAWEHKRSLSREVEERLDYTLGRYQKGGASYGLPPHLRPLVDAFTFTARYIEAAFGCRWHENKFTGRELARAISPVMAEFLSSADNVIPPKVLQRAKTHPAGEKAYLAHAGEEEARGVIVQLRLARAPGELFSEWEHELWKIRRDLEQLEKKR